MWWCHASCIVSVAGGDDLRDGCRFDDPSADVHAQGNDGSHELVAERIGPNRQMDLIVDPMPPGPLDTADQRTVPISSTQRSEVVFTDDG